MLDVSSLRREYRALSLDESSLDDSPMQQCAFWLKDAIATEPHDPTAMVVSTVDEDKRPDARVVLLKEIQPNGFVFYTHYLSAKGKQLAANRACALTLYWPILARQIRIRGYAQVLAAEQSDAYFATRPYWSQLSAMASSQSQPLADRQTLEQSIEQLCQHIPPGSVPRPSNWGGYLVEPVEIEFWQGRENRLHDRIVYGLVVSNKASMSCCQTTQAHRWHKVRLAP